MTTLPAGAELDKLVCVKVLGWRPSRPFGRFWCDREQSQPGGNGLRVEGFSPSISLTDSWYVVRFMRQRSSWLSLECRPCGDEPDDWMAYFSGPGGTGRGLTAPLAICRAALAALAAVQ